MKQLFVLALLAFLLPACGSPSAPPAPTYTPFPTFTPYPTQTPYPTYTPFPTQTLIPTYTPYPTYTAMPTPPSPSATPLAIKAAESPAAPRCIMWNVVPSHIGETTCVRGNVTSTYKDPKSNAFFIDFDDSWSSFYAISFKYTWDNLKGQCVEISGKIAPYNGRPQIIVESRSQLQLCK